MVISRPDRRPWAAVAFAVPLTIVGLGGVATHPSLFVPLLVLAGMALIVIEFFVDQPRAAEPPLV
jgi:hypothetical protein